MHPSTHSSPYLATCTITAYTKIYIVDNGAVIPHPHPSLLTSFHLPPSTHVPICSCAAAALAKTALAISFSLSRWKNCCI